MITACNRMTYACSYLGTDCVSCPIRECFVIADDVSFRVCGLLLLCCDSEHLAWFLLIAAALPSMEGPRQESQDADGTVVSALVGLPDDVLGTNAQSAATSLPAPGCAQPGNPTVPVLFTKRDLWDISVWA